MNLSVPLCQGCGYRLAPGGTVYAHSEWLDIFFAFADCLPHVGVNEGYVCSFQKVVNVDNFPSFPHIVTYPLFLGNCSEDPVDVRDDDPAVGAAFGDQAHSRAPVRQA